MKIIYTYIYCLIKILRPPTVHNSSDAHLHKAFICEVIQENKQNMVQHKLYLLIYVQFNTIIIYII